LDEWYQEHVLSWVFSYDYLDQLGCELFNEIVFLCLNGYNFVGVWTSLRRFYGAINEPLQ